MIFWLLYQRREIQKHFGCFKKKSKKNKIYSIGLLGSNGGNAKKYCNLNLIVQSNSVARTQESPYFFRSLHFRSSRKYAYKKN